MAYLWADVPLGNHSLRQSSCINNKLYAVCQTVGSVVHNKSLSRHETVIIKRLWIGHTGLTHSYLLSGDDQPTCSTCGHPPTVRHILLDCIDLQDVRWRHFSVTCLSCLCVVLLMMLYYDIMLYFVKNICVFCWHIAGKFWEARLPTVS